ncbi:uncharacterized protein TRAVEDRAFT_118064 [Trametes versicolor FP-101664 SS1]|uniref:uncharacterized protein n=1 Tax=Trametes versicolor (strain FP-101664) TaxID=717944 RepID=UPI00046225BA|nr:uncharacterized protein TRAVEDRAFT_118064 [Trametes versicolor FP-101664 SS1]EIW61286.1 hypothetical protein TRAVEDRAFT_118064 [Trametes versicolor FP-101664 SS1]
MAFLFPQPCPELPEYQNLLLKGPYHASAPVHLLLSHALTNPDAKAILLSPNRASFKDALVDLDDEWLDRNSGHGRVAYASRRTEIYYPPTLAHLRLLLSMLHEYDTTVHHEKTTLDAAPSLLVLHEISSYLDNASSETT